MSNLSPPPYRDKDLTSQAWQKWFASVQAILSPAASAGLMLWSAISKVGANLTDIPTRNHADLQNLNTTAYTHLSSDQYDGLTGGGVTTLHSHPASSTTTTSSIDSRRIVTLRL